MTMAGDRRQRYGRAVPGAVPPARLALAGAGVVEAVWFNFGPVGWSIVVVVGAFLFGTIGARW